MAEYQYKVGDWIKITKDEGGERVGHVAQIRSVNGMGSITYDQPGSTRFDWAATKDAFELTDPPAGMQGNFPTSDPVNHPNHYQIELRNGTTVEVMDILDARFGDDALLWNVGKYLLRAGHKDEMIQELKKQRVYLDRKISYLEEEEK